MIEDGMNRAGVLAHDDFTCEVVYRPATRRERDHLSWVVKSLDSFTSEWVLYRFVESHVEECEFREVNEHRRWWAKDFNDVYPAMFDQLVKLIHGVVPDKSGKLWDKEETALAHNLAEGIKFERDHKSLANRSCDDCKKYWYSDQTGQPILNNSTLLPLLREGPTMCETAAGCPKGTPEKQKSLSKRNRWVYQHYLECKAVGSFPDDPLVRQNALIIQKAEAAK